MRILGIRYNHAARAFILAVPEVAGALSAEGLDSVPARRRALPMEERFTRKKHDSRVPEATRFGLLPASCRRHHGRRTSTTRPSTTSPSSSSSASSRPTSPRPRLGPAVVPQGAAPVAEEEALHPRPDRSRCPASRQDALSRAPRVPRRVGLLPLALRAAAFLTIDGVGEWATTSYGVGGGNTGFEIQGDPLPALPGAALLGLHLLHRLQGQLGRVQGHGAGALRRAQVRQKILEHVIDLKEDGSFRLDQEYFDYCSGPAHDVGEVRPLFGGPPRQPESS